jgi:hypothetical protein
LAVVVDVSKKRRRRRSRLKLEREVVRHRLGVAGVDKPKPFGQHPNVLLVAGPELEAGAVQALGVAQLQVVAASLVDGPPVLEVHLDDERENVINYKNQQKKLKPTSFGGTTAFSS